MANCYNCGILLDGTNTTREHIPAQAQFTGLGQTETHNRITVPACLTCNRLYSVTTDEEFRNFIAVISADGLNDGLKLAADKGLYRNFNRYKERAGIIDGRIGIEFDFNLFKQYHVKNFKGLFHFRYRNPIGSNFLIGSDLDGDTPNPVTLNFIKYLTENFQYEISGHANVFKFIFTRIEKDKLPPEFESWQFNESYVALIVYNQVHASIVYAINQNEFTAFQNREAE